MSGEGSKSIFYADTQFKAASIGKLLRKKCIMFWHPLTLANSRFFYPCVEIMPTIKEEREAIASASNINKQEPSRR